MNFNSLLLAFWLGIAYAALPGTVTVESTRRGLKNGYWPAFAVGLGALIGDGTYAAIAFSGLDFILQNYWIKNSASLAGIIFLVYLAFSAFKSKTAEEIKENVQNKKNKNAFASGAVLSLTNPWAIAFWLGFGGILISSGVNANPHNLWSFLIMFLSGVAFWVFVFSGLILWGRKYVNDKIFRAISLASGLIFLGTAAYAAWELAMTL